PVRDRGAVRHPGARVAGEVVERHAVVRDLLGAIVTGDDVELAGDTAVGLQLALVVDLEGRPVVETDAWAAGALAGVRGVLREAVEGLAVLAGQELCRGALDGAARDLDLVALGLGRLGLTGARGLARGSSHAGRCGLAWRCGLARACGHTRRGGGRRRSC